VNATSHEYEITAESNRKVAALYCGRSFARFLFHSVQSALVDFPSRLNGNFENDGPSQSQLAFSALRSLYAHCLNLEGGAGKASHTIFAHAEELRVNHESDGEELNRLFDELASGESDEPDALRRSIVEILVAPRRERIDAAIQQVFSGELSWIGLGRALEEGLCRPDIYIFQQPFLNQYPVLRVDGYSAPQMNPLATIGDNELSDFSRPADNAMDIIHVEREPGDLAPHSLWRSNVEHYWSAVGLGSDALQPLADLLKKRDILANLRVALIECVDMLFETAVSSALGGAARLSVRIQTGDVMLDGKAFKVEPQAAYLLDDLRRNPGGISFPRLKDQRPDVFGKHEKLVDLKRRLPGELRNVIDSGRGKKVRLNL